MDGFLFTLFPSKSVVFKWTGAYEIHDASTWAGGSAQLGASSSSSNPTFRSDRCRIVPKILHAIAQDWPLGQSSSATTWCVSLNKITTPRISCIWNLDFSLEGPPIYRYWKNPPDSIFSTAVPCPSDRWTIRLHKAKMRDVAAYLGACKHLKVSDGWETGIDLSFSLICFVPSPLVMISDMWW